MKILGIGNAIVDVICKVEDSFLSKNNLTKSTMKLVDETEFKKILSILKIEETIAGGSVANSIVGLSQLGNSVSFIGKISDDKFIEVINYLIENEIISIDENFSEILELQKIPSWIQIIASWWIDQQIDDESFFEIL